jgi:hypothetical protein
MGKSIAVVIVVAVALVVVRGRADSSAALALSDRQYHLVRDRVAQARQVRHWRDPLFGRANRGNAMIDYAMAARMTRILLGGHRLSPFVYDASNWADVPEGAVVVSPGAHRIAELVVRGANRSFVAWNGSEIDTGARRDMLRLVLAAAFHSYGAGQHQRAYRYVLAVARAGQDLARVDEHASSIIHLAEHSDAIALLRHFVSAGELAGADLAELARAHRRLVASQQTLRELLLCETRAIDVYLLDAHAGVAVYDLPERLVADALVVDENVLDGAAKLSASTYRMWNELDFAKLADGDDIEAVVGAAAVGGWSPSPAVATMTLHRDELSVELASEIARSIYR